MKGHRILAASMLGLAVVANWFMPAAGAAEPRLWAVLIGTKKLEDPSFSKLEFTDADVKRLRGILTDRAGLVDEHLLEMTDHSPKDLRPSSGNIRRELPRFLSRVGPEDRVLVFYSGHGDRRKGRTYLVSADFDHKHPEETGVPLTTLRRALEGCKSKLKLLVLDCCHAGAARDGGEATLSSEAVAKGLDVEKLEDCVVLASCREKESSQEWADRRQGVFTYWLCRALEGAAADANGAVTIDRINDYVHDRVPITVKEIWGKGQTPVRLGRVEGNPTLVKLRPEPPETCCRRLAEELDLAIRRRKLKTVGVGAFYMPVGAGNRMGATPLPTYLAERVHKGLAALNGRAYVVRDLERVHKAEKGLGVEAIGDREKLTPLATEGLEGIIFGVVERRGYHLKLHVELIATASGETRAELNAFLALSEELLAMLGYTSDNFRRPNGNGPYDRAVLEYQQKQAGRPSPQLRDDFPFRVELVPVEKRPIRERKAKEFVTLDGRRHQGVQSSDLLVGVEEGELFEIRVTTRLPQRVGLTLLVDGINVLGQKRERLGKAWSFVLDGPDRKKGEKERVYRFEGWLLPKKEGANPGDLSQFQMKRFKVVDLSQSVAGRMKFGDSPGLIQAAFYAERGKALGVGEGPEERRDLRTVRFTAGRPLAFLNIRYVAKKELEKLTK